MYIIDIYCTVVLYIIIIILYTYNLFLHKTRFIYSFNLLICFSRSVISCKPGMNFKTVITYNIINYVAIIQIMI